MQIQGTKKWKEPGLRSQPFEFTFQLCHLILTTSDWTLDRISGSLTEK